jgi:hypothetical protein
LTDELLYPTSDNGVALQLENLALNNGLLRPDQNPPFAYSNEPENAEHHLQNPGVTAENLVG